MLTVLFVIVFLFVTIGAISLLDTQRISSREVRNYLHNEYNMALDYEPTLAQLRNIR